MATRAEVEAQRQAQADVVALAVAEFVAVWEASNLADPQQAIDQLAPVFAEIVATYGEMSASLAADFYDELREATGLRDGFSAQMAATIGADQAQASARWGLAPLRPTKVTVTDPESGEVVEESERPGSPDAALDRLAGSMQRHVAQPGRDTIAENVDRDPSDARWARVPTGGKTCAWCRILASRVDEQTGAGIYTSEHAALFREDGHKYHDWCDCTPVIVWGPADYPDGYDPEAYLNQYLDGREKAESGDIRDITKAMRKQLGVR